MENNRVELNIIAMSPSDGRENAYVVVLEDAAKKRRLPIIIGSAEAMAIGITVERLKTKRPMTHDLMLAMVQGLGAVAEQVCIREIVDGVFYSEIVLRSASGEALVLESRTSDALAFALKAGVPVYTYEHILNDSSYLTEIYASETSKVSFSSYTLEDLEALLRKVVEKEDFESAIRIRETIRRRQAGEGI